MKPSEVKARAAKARAAANDALAEAKASGMDKSAEARACALMSSNLNPIIAASETYGAHTGRERGPSAVLPEPGMRGVAASELATAALTRKMEND